MADKPIIFSSAMTRAILEGRKSQTRRILKPQPKLLNNGIWYRPYPVLRPRQWAYLHGDRVTGYAEVPYAVGDRLWVREGFAYGWPVKGNHQLPECNQEHAITYRADGNRPFGSGRRWKSPIHMPRWASRLTLIVTDVRVQRLQEISRGDAMAEGCPFPNMADGPNPREWFRDLWASLHGPEAWAANPWVAALTFTVHRCNIDNLPGGNNG